MSPSSHGAALDEVVEAARGGDEEVDAAVQGADLRRVGRGHRRRACASGPGRARAARARRTPAWPARGSGPARGRAGDAGGLGSPSASRDSIGRPKASVLPEPVWPRPRMSLPARRVRDGRGLDRERRGDAVTGEPLDEALGQAEGGEAVVGVHGHGAVDALAGGLHPGVGLHALGLGVDLAVEAPGRTVAAVEAARRTVGPVEAARRTVAAVEAARRTVRAVGAAGGALAAVEAARGAVGGAGRTVVTGGAGHRAVLTVVLTGTTALTTVSGITVIATSRAVVTGGLAALGPVVTVEGASRTVVTVEAAGRTVAAVEAARRAVVTVERAGRAVAAVEAARRAVVPVERAGRTVAAVEAARRAVVPAERAGRTVAAVAAVEAARRAVVPAERTGRTVAALVAAGGTVRTLGALGATVTVASRPRGIRAATGGCGGLAAVGLLGALRPRQPSGLGSNGPFWARRIAGSWAQMFNSLQVLEVDTSRATWRGQRRRRASGPMGPLDRINSCHPVVCSRSRECVCGACAT